MGATSTKVWLLLVAACQSKDASPPPKDPPPPIAPVVFDATLPLPDWSRCKTALETAAKLPGPPRALAVIDGCTPCGDWKPLLEWSTPHTDGGPPRHAIESAMLACEAYCDANAKQRFLGTLDTSRGKHTRGPWRYLGEMCKDAVSAVPDARFMTAPFFALDRIGRAVAARPDLAPLLAGLEIPLPAVSVTGAGIELLESPSVSPDPGTSALTVNAKEIRIAAMPRGKLGAQGVTVIAAGDAYPGVLVANPKEVATQLERLSATGPISLFAPPGMAARRVLDVLAITTRRDVRFAAKVGGAPIGWELTGTVPVALVTADTSPGAEPSKVILKLGASPDGAIKDAKARMTELPAGITILIGKDATVAALAKLVGALAYFEVKSIVLAPGKP